MASSLTRQIAMLSESRSVTFQELAPVSAALQKQVARDLELVWDVRATVDASDTLKHFSDTESR